MNDDAIKHSPDVYLCPRHGESKAWMLVTIMGDKIDEVALERHYCLHCLVEKFDKLGVQDMDKVQRPRGAQQP